MSTQVETYEGENVTSHRNKKTEIGGLIRLPSTRWHASTGQVGEDLVLISVGRKAFAGQLICTSLSLENLCLLSCGI